MKTSQNKAKNAQLGATTTSSKRKKGRGYWDEPEVEINANVGTTVGDVAMSDNNRTLAFACAGSDQ